MDNSNSFTGRACRDGSPMSRNIKTSAAVTRTAAHNGSEGNRRQRPMADPSSSAKSVQMIATSQSTYKGYRTQYRMRRRCFGRSCSSKRQCVAKSTPVTHPSLLANDCNLMSDNRQIRSGCSSCAPEALLHLCLPTTQRKAVACTRIESLLADRRSSFP